MWFDLRFAARQFLSTPGYAVLAVVILGLGLGANTVLFSAIDAVLLRPLPYRDPEALAAVSDYYVKYPEPRWTPMTAKDIAALTSQSRLFTEWAAFNCLFSRNLAGPSTSERLHGWRVSPGFFATLGVPTVAGTPFAPEAGQPGAAPVVVLSERLWQRQFNRDTNLLGRTIRLEDEHYTVVGIARHDLPLKPFSFIAAPDFWLPMRLDAPGPGTAPNAFLVGRLRPGVALAAAQAELDAIAGRIYPADAGQALQCRRLQDMVVRRSRPGLWLLFGAVACVLLIACTSLASLLLARSVAREKEIAIRLALGASRRQVIRGLSAESLLLAGLGGALGVLLAFWGVHGLAAWNAGEIPRLSEVQIDYRVLGFALALALGSALLLSWLPACLATQPHLIDSLKAGDRRSTPTRTGQRSLSALVIAEIALAAVLLTGAGLMVTSLRRLHQVKLGFLADEALTLRVSLPRPGFSAPAAGGLVNVTPAVGRLFQQVIERIEALPGVHSVGASSGQVLSGKYWEDVAFEVEGRPVQGSRPIAFLNYVSPRYFEAMGIPLLQGRRFSDGDATDAARPIMVSQAAARQLFGDENPIGRRIRLASAVSGVEKSAREIVGVVGEVAGRSLEDTPHPQLYASYLHQERRLMDAQLDSLLGMTLVVRAAPPRATTGLADTLRTLLREVDPQAAMHDVQPLESIVRDQTAERRFYRLLLGTFAVTATGLAALGVFGVMAFSVNQRTHEVGLRRALGARSAAVVCWIVRRGMRLCLTGVTLGMVACLGLGRFLGAQLYEVSPTDPLTYASSALLLIAVSLLACWLPARRAARVDPMVALRCE